MAIGKNKRKHRMFNLLVKSGQATVGPLDVIKHTGNALEIVGDRGSRIELATGMPVRILTTTNVSGKPTPVRYTYTSGQIVVKKDQTVEIVVPKDKPLVEGKEYQLLIPEEAVIKEPSVINWDFFKR